MCKKTHASNCDGKFFDLIGTCWLLVGRSFNKEGMFRRGGCPSEREAPPSAARMELLEELQAHVLCGDGAMGTMLLSAGIRLEKCFKELCVSEPERIGEIHRQYVAAGARVLKTNTFGANAVRLERFGLQGRVLEMNRAAAQIAKTAAENKGVYVAGSVGPLGITGKEAAARGIDRAKCFREQLSALREGEVDLVVFETFMDVEEMEIALREWTVSGGGPALCSFACVREGRISSGILLEDAFAKMRALGAP